MLSIVCTAIDDLPTKPSKIGYAGNAGTAVQYFKDGAYHAQLCGIDPDYLLLLLRKNSVWKEIFVD